MKTKKKKKKIRIRCYVEDLKQWVTIKEAVEYSLNPTRTTETSEVAPQVKHIRNFLEEFGGHPTNTSIDEGYYEGLPDFLKERGKNKSAKLLKTPAALPLINMAWQTYRMKHPRRFTPLPIEQTRPTPETRKKLFNHDTSSIIRRLALEGYNAKEIRRVMDHYKIEVKDTTIKGQMWCAQQKGKYGLSADLSENELECIFDVIIATSKRKRTQTEAPVKNKKHAVDSKRKRR